MNEQLLSAVQKAYDINRWLLPCVQRFPRNYKFTLGDRLQTTGLDLNLALVEAAHSQSKQRPLYRANRLLDQLRILLRLARDLEIISARQHEHISRWNEELGRMIGGWIRASRQERHGASGAASLNRS